MDYLAALAIAVGSWLAVPGGAWTPTQDDVAEARSQLEPYAWQQAAQWGEVLPDWSSYTFQYQGQERGGKKILLVNAFCSEPPASAATEMVLVFDGGPCYFTAHWDPVEKRFIGIGFNGHA
jgi:hypothetical protein